MRSTSTLSMAGRNLMTNSSSTKSVSSPIAVSKKSFSGKRPRPEYIKNPFDSHYNMFEGQFTNNSTNPTKYVPSKLDYDFQLDLGKIKGRENNYYTARPTMYSQSTNQTSLKDLLQQDLQTKQYSPSRIGKSKVAAVYPSGVEKELRAHPKAPFATFRNEGLQGEYFFHTLDKQNVVDV